MAEPVGAGVAVGLVDAFLEEAAGAPDAVAQAPANGGVSSLDLLDLLGAVAVAEDLGVRGALRDLLRATAGDRALAVPAHLAVALLGLALTRAGLRLEEAEEAGLGAESGGLLGAAGLPERPHHVRRLIALAVQEAAVEEDLAEGRLGLLVVDGAVVGEGRVEGFAGLCPGFDGLLVDMRRLHDLPKTLQNGGSLLRVEVFYYTSSHPPVASLSGR